MKTMKKIYKRILTFVLAASLTLTYPIMASAAELDENPIDISSTVVEDGYIVDEVSWCDEDGTWYTTYTLNTSYIDTSHNGASSGSKYEDSFTMSRAERLNIYLQIEGSCQIVVRLNWGLLWSNTLDETVTNDTIWKYVDLGKDIGVTVTLTFKQKSNYTLRVWGE